MYLGEVPLSTKVRLACDHPGGCDALIEVTAVGKRPGHAISGEVSWYVQDPEGWRTVGRGPDESIVCACPAHHEFLGW